MLNAINLLTKTSLFDTKKLKKQNAIQPEFQSKSLVFKANTPTDTYSKNTAKRLSPETKNKIITGAIIAGVSAVALFLLGKDKNTSRAEVQINSMQKEIEQALNQNSALNRKVTALKSNRFSLECFPELINQKSSCFQDLINFQTILAMDSADMAPDNLKIPELITFKKMDDTTFSKLKQVLFKAFRIQNYEIEYSGNLQDVVEKLSTISDRNPQYRVFIDIKDLPNKFFARDIKENQAQLDILKDFFTKIKDKKITFITSNASLINLFNSFEKKPKAMEFNYRVENLADFIQVILDSNERFQ